MLRILANSRLHQARSVLIAESRIAKAAPLLADFADDVAIYAARRPVMDAIAGFPIHRGFLAFGERGQMVGAADLLGGIDGQATVVCLFGVSNHDNVGGVFRNAAAFGVRAVLLDPACCDPLYRKAIRVSVGAALTVPFARLGPGEDALALFDQHGFTTLALSPSGVVPLTGLRPPTRAAALLGAEGAGLPAAILAGATTAAIPMTAGFDSLNLATASGIVLHHLAHQPAPVGTTTEERG